uniref:Transmembrane protein 243 n=1 Tax=Maylandia zebra TaxID=106582 RepID=A0A3P9CH05_9CICH
MDDFTTRTYGTSGLDNRPLFGETSARDRIINTAVGGFTSVVVLVTVICSFVFPTMPPRPLNIFFAVCILLTCSSTLVLVNKHGQMLTQRSPGHRREPLNVCSLSCRYSGTGRATWSPNSGI